MLEIMVYHKNRERVFCISELNDENKFEFPKSRELKLKLYDILEKMLIANII